MSNFSIRTDRADPWAPSTLALRFIVNLAGLWIASEIVPGVHVDDLPSLLAGTAIFAIVNMLLRPLANLVSCCLIVFTFGLFVLVINALLLATTAWIAGKLNLAFRVDGFWAAFFGALVISTVSLVASLLIRPPRVQRS
ncbi:MAG: phage holin family protein [Dehalococcoidia bacterium]|nr:MAG: phage holin family protein [Dehalococcoidia bacterium]